MKYKQCEVEYTDETSEIEIKATSFYIQSRKKAKKHTRGKDERRFWKEREERE